MSGRRSRRVAVAPPPAGGRARTFGPWESAVGEVGNREGGGLFFVNSETGRGNLIYHRYDGHYGFIEPAR
jgi:hypothetical protein